MQPISVYPVAPDRLAAVWPTPLSVAAMAVEAQMVVAFRTMGLMGLWAVAPGEASRMVVEKPAAFNRAAAAATRAAMAGRGPDEVMAAALASLRGRTRANMRRLARRGTRAR